MKLLRTDQQVAMNAFYAAIRKSAAHYQDAAMFLDNAQLSATFKELAEQRQALSRKVKAAIRTLDDLPAEPDPDRESLEQLAHHISARVSADQAAGILQQRMANEQEVHDLASDARETALDANCAALVDEVEKHVQTISKRLQSLIDTHPA